MCMIVHLVILIVMWLCVVYVCSVSRSVWSELSIVGVVECDTPHSVVHILLS